jgi:hypothetical protein
MKGEQELKNQPTSNRAEPRAPRSRDTEENKEGDRGWLK